MTPAGAHTAPDPDERLSAWAVYSRILHCSRTEFARMVRNGLRLDERGRTCRRWIQEYEDRRMTQPEQGCALADDAYNRHFSNIIRS